MAASSSSITIDRSILAARLAEEIARFEREHPESKRLYARAQKSMFKGVPMLWMIRSPGTYPVFVREGHGCHFYDVDGHRYLDLCLGDTGAMTGHAPARSTDAICERVRQGITFMLPSEDAIWVGEELTRRFGMPYWQLTLTATDANRNAIRLARQITGRSKVLVFNYCYHGTVDETLITLDSDGKGVHRRGNTGAPVHPSVTTRVVEFNDEAALARELAHGDVACVLAEPAMTNIGIVMPKPGFLEAMQRLTRDAGALLIIDETHTISAGPGGYFRQCGLTPDIFVLGKPIASGVPAAVWGFSHEVARAFEAHLVQDESDTGGLGGTLAGNALSLAALRSTLEYVLTDAAYERMIELCTRLRNGVQSVIDHYRLPWCITQLGARAEYWFDHSAPRNGGDAAATMDHELERYMHLAALNRRVLITPFHNMMLVSPQATAEDIDHHTRVFRESVEALLVAPTKASSKL